MVTGFFGDMGGCAMIGQSIININSGGRGRLSGITAALSLLCLFFYGLPLPSEINSLYRLCDNPQQFLPQACTTLRDCLQPRTLQTTEAFMAEVDQRLLMMAKGFFNISS